MCEDFIITVLHCLSSHVAFIHQIFDFTGSVFLGHAQNFCLLPLDCVRDIRPTLFDFLVSDLSLYDGLFCFVITEGD